MSDIFSPQEDGSELQGDTPGIGAAPSAPRGVPSALAGLANSFQQLFSGRPAPQAARPGPSPFQFPGRSQIPQGPEQDQGPRQTGTTSSLALPKGSPQPRDRFTPYVPTLPRHFSQWGQPEPFPRLPQSFELPGIYGGLSQFFGQNGSAFSSPIALLMGRYAGDYQKGVMEGQKFKAQMAKEKLAEQAVLLQRRQEAEMTEYHDIFDEYSVLQGEADPAKITRTIKGVGLQDALWNKAKEIGDDKVAALIESGAGVAQVMAFEAAREAKFQDLSKANKKTEDQTAEDTGWDLTPAEKSTSAPAGSSIDPAAQFNRPGPAAPAIDPATGKPAPKPVEAAPPKDDPGAPKLESNTDEEADNVVRGIEPSTALPPDVRRAVLLRGANKLSKIDKLIADPNLKPEDVIPAAKRELGPGIGAELENYANYSKGPSAGGLGGSGGKEQGYWNRLASLAKKARPGNPDGGVAGWNQATFQAIQQFRDESQKQNSPIQRIPTVAAAGEQVLNDLDLIQKKYGKGANTSLASVKGKLGLDPLYSALYGDWLNYNQDVNVLTTSPSVTETKAAEDTVRWYGSASAYRAVVKNHMGVADSRIGQLHGQWNSYGTGDQMPGYNPQAEQSIDKIKRLDPVSGLMPGGTLTDKTGKKWTYTGKNARDPDAEENWVKQ
jgi:hypothetical protein